MTTEELIDYWVRGATEDVYKKATKEYTENYLNKAREIYKWLMTKL